MYIYIYVCCQIGELNAAHHAATVHLMAAHTAEIESTQSANTTPPRGHSRPATPSGTTQLETQVNVGKQQYLQLQDQLVLPSMLLLL